MNNNCSSSKKISDSDSRLEKPTNKELSTVLELITNLTRQELMVLNQAVISQIKIKEDVDFKTAAISFNKGDIVSFIDSRGVQTYGVVTKKNPKTLQVTTVDNYYINLPATYIKLEEKPSADLIKFRKKIAPTYEEMYEMLGVEVKKDPLQGTISTTEKQKR